MELWDAYDRNFKKIEGITLIRGEESSIPKPSMKSLERAEAI